MNLHLIDLVLIHLLLLLAVVALLIVSIGMAVEVWKDR